MLFATVTAELTTWWAQFVTDYGYVQVGILGVVTAFAVVALIRKGARKGIGSI